MVEKTVVKSIKFYSKILLDETGNNKSDYPLMWHQNTGSRLFRFATKQLCDRQTDGQNYDPQDRANMAASCGTNYLLSNN